MNFHVSHATCLFQHVAKRAAHRMRKRDVGHNAFAKERRLLDAPTRPIEKLIGNYHVERRVLFLQRSHRRRRQDSFDAQHFHRVYVRAKWHFSRREKMSATMPRQKRNSLSLECADDQGVRRITKGRVDFHFLDLGQLRHLVQPAATNDAHQNSRRTAHESVSDRKSTRLNSSHGYISYAVFCLKKKKKT